jgi:hypothetical protein
MQDLSSPSKHYGVGDDLSFTSNVFPSGPRESRVRALVPDSCAFLLFSN